MKILSLLVAALAALGFTSCSSHEESTVQIPAETSNAAICNQWATARAALEEFDLESDTDAAMGIIGELWLLFAIADDTDFHEVVFAYGNSIWNQDRHQEEVYRRELAQRCAGIAEVVSSAE